jgi:hypothetical protein
MDRSESEFCQSYRTSVVGNVDNDDVGHSLAIGLVKTSRHGWLAVQTVEGLIYILSSPPFSRGDQNEILLEGQYYATILTC